METESGQWAIVEIMGRKVVAGYITQAIQFGLPMLRIDIPTTTIFPAFTQDYGAQAIYSITYVSEQVARMTAEANKVNPVSVYVPDLAAAQRAMLENEQLHKRLEQLSLPDGMPPCGDESEDDDDDDDADYDDNDEEAQRLADEF
jgi:hypothetical protein